MQRKTQKIIRRFDTAYLPWKPQPRENQQSVIIFFNLTERTILNFITIELTKTVQQDIGS